MVAARGEDGGQQLEKTAAKERLVEELGGVAFGQAGHEDELEPALELALAQEGQGVAHRLDLCFEAKEGRVDIAQELKREAEVAFEDALELVEIELGLLQLFEGVEMGEL